MGGSDNPNGTEKQKMRDAFGGINKGSLNYQRGSLPPIVTPGAVNGRPIGMNIGAKTGSRMDGFDPNNLHNKPRFGDMFKGKRILF